MLGEVMNRSLSSRSIVRMMKPLETTATWSSGTLRPDKDSLRSSALERQGTHRCATQTADDPVSSAQMWNTQASFCNKELDREQGSIEDERMANRVGDGERLASHGLRRGRLPAWGRSKRTDMRRGTDAQQCNSPAP